MQALIYTVVILGIMGFAGGLGLSIAAKVFEVKENPKIEEIVKILPGANCGLCGYPGCSAYAHAVVEKGASNDLCVPGKKAGVSDKIKKIIEEK